MPTSWLIDDEARLQTLRDFGLVDTPAEEAFDDIVTEAAALCATPVALIALLEQERQWFKARVGTEISETPIEMAICRHALAAGDLLVIPDLTRDARTAANPIVAGDPQVRFYAGIPLVVDDQALGSLCVLDFAARPDGLTEAEKDGLRTLAARAQELIEAR